MHDKATLFYKGYKRETKEKLNEWEIERGEKGNKKHTQSSLDYPDLDYPDHDYPDLDYPDLDYPDLDYPDLDYQDFFSGPNFFTNIK